MYRGFTIVGEKLQNVGFCLAQKAFKPVDIYYTQSEFQKRMPKHKHIRNCAHYMLLLFYIEYY